MRLSLLFILSTFFFFSCKNNDTSTTVSIFNAAPGAGDATVEINGNTSNKTPEFGKLVSGFKAEPGPNTINLVAPGSTANPLASFEGEIDGDAKLSIFFTATNDAAGINSFTASSANLPEAPNSAAQVRFINASSIPDTVRFVTIKDGNAQAADTTDEAPYSTVTDFNRVGLQVGTNTSYTVKVIAKREASSGGPGGGSQIKYVDLASETFSIRGTQVISYVFYGFESVTAKLDITGIVEKD